MLNIWSNLLTTVLKMRNRMAVWVWNGGKCIYKLFPLVTMCLTGSWGSLAAAAKHRERVPGRISRPGKDQIHNLKYLFYWMHIAFKSSWSWKIVSQTILSRGPQNFPSMRHTCRKRWWVLVPWWDFIITCL